MSVQTVFDIDLDFFVRPTFEVKSDEDPRPKNGGATIDTVEQVVKFLTQSIGLDPQNPIPGAVVKHHVEVLDHWEMLIKAETLQPKFSVVHIDAHGDVFGYEGNKRVHSGNYLIHAVRRGWLNHIYFVYPDEKQDLPGAYLTHDLKLKFCEEVISFSVLDRSDFDGECAIRKLKPDFLFLATSPASTPENADTLIPTITNFIRPI